MSVAFSANDFVGTIENKLVGAPAVAGIPPLRLRARRAGHLYEFSALIQAIGSAGSGGAALVLFAGNNDILLGEDVADGLSRCGKFHRQFLAVQLHLRIV